MNRRPSHRLPWSEWVATAVAVAVILYLLSIEGLNWQLISWLLGSFGAGYLGGLAYDLTFHR